MKKLFLRLLPAGAKSTIKRLALFAERASVSLFARHRFLAALYYCFFSREFDREHLAVLRGRREYWRSLRRIESTSALLRRNVHRLEKALIMRPRRGTFADRYIGETVDCYGRCLAAGTLDAAEHRWASDVLAEYFRAVGTSPVIDRAREHYEGLMQRHGDNARGDGKAVPYEYRTLSGTDISFESLNALFTQRRSVRWYRDEPVDMALLRRAVNAASLAPSACNRQPYRFHIANGNARARDIAGCAMGTTGYSHNLPCVIAVVGDLSAYPEERDRHVIYVDASLAAMQLMLALETLGLSSCPINWPDVESRERMLANKLGLRYHERPVMLLAVGYADPSGGIPYSQKKSDVLLVREVVDDH